MSNIEKHLGHVFVDPNHLHQALTHASGSKTRIDSNERLEFLGDRVLGLIVAHMLIERFPKEEEGTLGYRFTALVRRETLAAVASELKLGSFIKLSNSERETGGAEKKGVLADTCEAVIAALYLDGGLKIAKQFVHRYWGPLVDVQPDPVKDPKTTLQERAQADRKTLPVYNVIDHQGPDHAPIFTVEARLEDGTAETGVGPNKRSAEQAAAEALLKLIASKDNTT